MKIRNFGHCKLGRRWLAQITIGSLFLVGNIGSTFAYNITANTNPTFRDQAKRIHDRLVGVPPTEGALNVMANFIDPNADGDGDSSNESSAVEAALYAMTTSNNDPAVGNPRGWLFYTVSLKNWVTPWTNVEQTVFAPLNDYTATVIGMVFNEDPFNEVLSASYIYTGNSATLPGNLNIPPYSRTNNDHYEALEDNNVDLSQHLVRTEQVALGIAGSAATPSDSAGVITTRAAGEAFFSAGTNRRMLRFTLMNFMCRDLEDVKDITRVPDGIRQDVSRSPGGDSSLFLNSCIGCHAGMDPLAGAYAYYEWTEDENGNNGQVIHSNGNFVQPKHHINSTNFEYGYVTKDDSWKNYWRKGPNINLGWDSGLPGQGNGAKTLGQEIANTDAFAQCQVEKVYKQVCLQDPISTHAGQIEAITNSFMGNNYNLKEVFADVAALCMGN